MTVATKTRLPTAVTVAELAVKLRSFAWTHKQQARHPIGLHCWPRGQHTAVDASGRAYPHPNWFGIGPVAWGNETIPAWFDVRISDTDYGYHAVNDALFQACRETGLEFINMG
jgi:hypothetical protein